jgi:hypothetical protein
MQVPDGVNFATQISSNPSLCGNCVDLRNGMSALPEYPAITIDVSLAMFTA